MPEYFRVKDWEHFQHYRRRNPPWIRLYVALLRDPRYQQLTDTSRSHLLGVFMIASAHQNQLSTRQKWLKHELCTRYPIDLKTLEELGWIEFIEEGANASNVLATCYPRDRDRYTETDNSETDISETETCESETESEIQKRLRLTLEHYRTVDNGDGDF